MMNTQVVIVTPEKSTAFTVGSSLSVTEELARVYLSKVPNLTPDACIGALWFMRPARSPEPAHRPTLVIDFNLNKVRRFSDSDDPFEVGEVSLEEFLLDN